MVGHGTRSADGVREFEALVERTRKRAGGALSGSGAGPDADPDAGPDVAGGFIELSAPPLADAVAELAARGHRELTAVPLVLVSAGHAKGDVPATLARERRRHPGLSCRYGRPLGPHPTLLSLLEARVDEVLDPGLRAETAVILVGRGSTDPDANAEVAKVARLLWEGRGFAFTDPAFVSLAWPGVPAALERARLLGARRIAVAPYFLFPGVLPDRVASQAREYAAAHPSLDVRVAGVLGDCDELAGLVVERYREALAGDIRMNCDTCVHRVAMPGFEHRLGAVQSPHDHPHDPVHPHV